jgi:predicted metal-dependent enzyme (double-stranded beta helix superfamily)
VDQWIGDLRASVSRAIRESPDVDAAMQRLQKLLHDFVESGRIRLAEQFHEVRQDHYARRLLYRDTENGTVAVVMTWGPGQSTPIHDHSGVWCVEAVVSGRMEVKQYDLTQRRGDLCRLTPTDTIIAEVGSTGSLIPPFEYHVLGNKSDKPSLTLHIYGAEMKQCHVYLPDHDDWYKKAERALEFTE